MKIKKLKKKQLWLCEVGGEHYIRTETQWMGGNKPTKITWFLKESLTQGYKPLTDKKLEKIFWENNIKTNRL